MKIWILLLSLLFLKCNGDLSKDFKLTVLEKSKKYTPNDTLRFKIINKKNHPIDSVVYQLEGQKIDELHPLKNRTLGIYDVTASVYVSGRKSDYAEKITIVAPVKPKLYTYSIINEFPHDKTAYTQGLEFYRDTLYESTGLRGKSSLRKVDFKTGKVLQKIDLDKVYFGEGISILNNKLYQLTWQGEMGFQYKPDHLKMERSFAYQDSKEGWGLCNDGQNLYKSDGTHQIWILDGNTQKEIGKIQVMTDKNALKKINELEWVEGKIYANTYQFKKEVGVIINPQTGAVEGVIDFSGLKRKVEQVSNLDVLNGIAYHPKRKTFFVTGKNWSKLFEVKINLKP
ncbi:MAG: glutaminyl-peptide cyclotransferase [Flavobacteriaceae bacterium]|nr:glutaminyl-peptide cyclotransferase [Flavobacteriaceae bacterium]